MSDNLRITGEIEQRIVTVATQGPQGPAGRTDGYVLVQSAADLSSYLDASGDFYNLPAGTKVVLSGAVDIGSRYINLGEGGLLRGFANDSLISTNAGGVVRCSGHAEAVLLREFNIIAPAGPCLALSGPIDQQLNMFFVGMIGAAAGTITGFDVQAVKQCYVSAPIGLRHAGTTNKVFVADMPFYGITAGNAATILDAGLVAAAVDISRTFYKANAGVAIRAEAGYSVQNGVIHDGIVQGTMDSFDGFTSADANWDVRSVSGVADSRIVAQSNATGETTANITAVDSPVRITAPSASGLNIERFANDGSSTLTYTGMNPATVTASASMQINPLANNVDFTVYIVKNGLPINGTGVSGFVSGGGDKRAVTITDIVSLETGDDISVFIQNDANDADIIVDGLRINVMG